MAVGDVIRSPAWGNAAYAITQEFGTIDPSTADMYPGEYTEPLGWPAGTHVGLDIDVPKHTPIFALNPGEVLLANPNKVDPYFRPKPVWILTKDNPDTPTKDESGYTEIYGHLWTNTVSTGDSVRAGQALGTSGEQTHSGTMNPDGTMPHLHFELRSPQGRAVNPRGWLTVSQTLPDEDGAPDEEPDAPSGLPIEGLTGLGDFLKDAGRRTVFVAIGILLLAIGAYAVIKA